MKHENMQSAIDEMHSELKIPKRACKAVLMDVMATDSEIHPVQGRCPAHVAALVPDMVAYH